MAKHHVETPADVQIAAMQQAERRLGNLLDAGSGTPWEDRGSIGGIAAFFKTAFMSMFSPRKLLWSIHRPETAGDARIFTLLCGICWGIGWLIQDILDFKWSGREFEMVNDGYVWVLHLVLGIAGTWVLLGFMTRLFYKLVSAGDMRQKFPPVLAFNVYAYCLGPSVLALIPFHIGPAIALVWIFFLFIYAAIGRLAIKPGGAIICNTLIFWGTAGASIGAYLLLRWLVVYLYGPAAPGA